MKHLEEPDPRRGYQNAFVNIPSIEDSTLTPSPTQDHADYFTHRGYNDYDKHDRYSPGMVSDRVLTPAMAGGMTRHPIQMGNPSVIALWAFATASAISSTYNLFYPGSRHLFLLPTALVMGGLTQLVSGFLDMFYGGTYTCTIFISYGAHWTAHGISMLPPIQAMMDKYEATEPIEQEIAVYHYIWAIYTLFHVAISFRVRAGNIVTTWVMTSVFLTFFLQGLYFSTHSTPLLRTSGVTGYLASIGAYYIGLAATFKEQHVRLWLGKYAWCPKD